jgi:hypothetical protein
MGVQVTIGDATKTLASRIWDTWIPFGTESETEVTTVASCRIPLADILAAGKCGFPPETVQGLTGCGGSHQDGLLLAGLGVPQNRLWIKKGACNGKTCIGKSELSDFPMQVKGHFQEPRLSLEHSKNLAVTRAFRACLMNSRRLSWSVVQARRAGLGS